MTAETVVAKRPRLVRTTGNWRVGDAGDGCSWCGDRPSNGHLFVYFSTLEAAERAVRTDALFAEPHYCGLHCWGQDNGWSEL